MLSKAGSHHGPKSGNISQQVACCLHKAPCWLQLLACGSPIEHACPVSRDKVEPDSGGKKTKLQWVVEAKNDVQIGCVIASRFGQIWWNELAIQLLAIMQQSELQEHVLQYIL